MAQARRTTVRRAAVSRPEAGRCAGARAHYPRRAQTMTVMPPCTKYV